MQDTPLDKQLLDFLTSLNSSTAIFDVLAKKFAHMGG